MRLRRIIWKRPPDNAPEAQARASFVDRMMTPGSFVLIEGFGTITRIVHAGSRIA